MPPRTNQKARTRATLLEAARRLMADDQAVTLARVAKEANTSRATVYRYFSDPGVLAADAMLDIEVMATSDLLEGINDVRSRVHAVARYYLEFSRQHETLFRQFLAKSLTASGKRDGVKMRGARRLAAFEEALEPVRKQLRPDDLLDLSMRLSMTTGMEQFVILEDILRVDHPTGDRLLAGMVDALLDRYLPKG